MNAKTIGTYIIAIIAIFAAGAGTGYLYTRGNFSEQLDRAERQVEALEKSNNRLRITNEYLGKSISRFERRIAELEGILGDIRETNRGLRESLAELERRIGEAEGTLSDIAAGISESLGNIEELIEFVERLREQLQQYFAST